MNSKTHLIIVHILNIYSFKTISMQSAEINERINYRSIQSLEMKSSVIVVTMLERTNTNYIPFSILRNYINII